jgi:protein-S-isoprenylcysteine O-methyltransferase Ste14
MRRVLPPTYLFVALVVMVLLHLLLPVHRYLVFPVTLVGLVPVTLGLLLNVVADREFKRHQTTVKPYQESSALVTTFPFSISRHPMYLGLTLLLLGVALLLGTVSALLPVVMFPYVMNRIFIRMEEQMLAAKFGAEWHQYRSIVRRWI